MLGLGRFSVIAITITTPTIQAVKDSKLLSFAGDGEEEEEGEGDFQFNGNVE